MAINIPIHEHLKCRSNVLIERDRVAEWTRKHDPYTGSTRDSLQVKDTERRRIKRVPHANGSKKGWWFKSDEDDLNRKTESEHRLCLGLNKPRFRRQARHSSPASLCSVTMPSL